MRLAKVELTRVSVHHIPADIFYPIDHGAGRHEANQEAGEKEAREDHGAARVVHSTLTLNYLIPKP